MELALPTGKRKPREPDRPTTYWPSRVIARPSLAESPDNVGMSVRVGGPARAFVAPAVIATTAIGSASFFSLALRLCLVVERGIYAFLSLCGFDLRFGCLVMAKLFCSVATAELAGSTDQSWFSAGSLPLAEPIASTTLYPFGLSIG